MPELQLLEIQGKNFSGNAMMLYKPFLGEARDLPAVYVDLAAWKWHRDRQGAWSRRTWANHKPCTCLCRRCSGRTFLTVRPRRVSALQSDDLDKYLAAPGEVPKTGTLPAARGRLPLRLPPKPDSSRFYFTGKEDISASSAWARIAIRGDIVTALCAVLHEQRRSALRSSLPILRVQELDYPQPLIRTQTAEFIQRLENHDRCSRVYIFVCAKSLSFTKNLGPAIGAKTLLVFPAKSQRNFRVADSF